MRFFGLDVHRDFREVAICERGRARSAGRIATTRDALELFAASLAPDDRVVLESTGNALAIANVLRAHALEVVLANPMQVRTISHAKVKNDRVDARTLAKLLAADLLPEVWIADEPTRALRRLTSRRTQLVRQRTRTKNEVSAVLVAQPDHQAGGQRPVWQGRASVAGHARAPGRGGGSPRRRHWPGDEPDALPPSGAWPP